DAGYRTYIVHYPEKRFGVVVLSNVSTFDPTGLANRIADAYLTDHYPPDPPKPAATAPPANTPPAITVDPARLREYVGLYEIALDRYLNVTLNGGTLTAQMMTPQETSPARSLRAESET